MFDGFLGSNEKAASVCASAGHLRDAISKGATIAGYSIKRQELKYDLDFTQVFEIKGIEPGSPYEELFHKRKRFSYQHEIRSLISNGSCPLKKMVFQFNTKNLEKTVCFMMSQATMA